MINTEQPGQGFDITTSTAAQIESAVDTLYGLWGSQAPELYDGGLTLLVADHEEYACLGTECMDRISAMRDTLFIVPGIRRLDGSLTLCVLCAITLIPNQ